MLILPLLLLPPTLTEREEKLKLQAAAMAKFEEEQMLKRMSEEDRNAYLAEKARVAAEAARKIEEARLAEEARLKALEPKPEAPTPSRFSIRSSPLKTRKTSAAAAGGVDKDGAPVGQTAGGTGCACTIS
jgi:hypothetical protein